MSELKFRPELGSSELQELVLPVEVRKSNLALVKRVLSTETLPVEPGEYHVTTTLPAGQQLYSHVVVGEGEQSTVVLQPHLTAASAREGYGTQRYIVGAERRVVTAEPRIESLGAEDLPAKLRIFAGNVLQGALQVTDADAWLQPLSAPVRGVARFRCRPGRSQIAQLMQPGAPPLNLVLPVSPMQGCQLSVILGSDGRFTAEGLLENLEANAILRYSEQGLLGFAHTATDATSFESLLAGKVTDPIAAAAGAYALLRLGELDRLHNWSANLMEWFNWLPDGAVIRAEHLARIGEHAAALKVLLELPARGLPIFSDGLTYAMSRLRLYGGLSASVLEGFDRERTQAILLSLQRFADVADFRKPILTFTGLDPANPDDDDLSGERLEKIEGMVVSPHLDNPDLAETIFERLTTDSIVRPGTTPKSFAFLLDALQRLHDRTALVHSLYEKLYSRQTELYEKREPTDAIEYLIQYIEDETNLPLTDKDREPTFRIILNRMSDPANIIAIRASIV